MWHEIFAGVYFCGLTFFVFCGNSFMRFGRSGFSWWELIFAIFKKLRSNVRIDNIFVFIEDVQSKYMF